jgi:hypothetical protein
MSRSWVLYNEAAKLRYRLEAAFSRSCPFGKYLRFDIQTEKRIGKILDQAFLRQQRRLRKYQVEDEKRWA